MRVSLIFILFVALAGCSQKKPEAPHVTFGCTTVNLQDCLNSLPKSPFPEETPKPSREAEVYAELWKICAAKKLKYRVSDIQLGAFAWAWDEKHTSDDISKINHWTGMDGLMGHDTTKAAEDLIQKLAGPPNVVVTPTFDTGEVRPR